jgi:RNA polymerase sigma-70 factor (ECF subfamily)
MEASAIEDGGDVTALLTAFARGEARAADRLIPLVYDELRQIARRRRWRWGNRQMPGTTSLVHEAFVNLVDRSHGDWQSLAHFYYFASVAMRNVLIDSAKSSCRQKRGGGGVIAETDSLAITEQRSEDLLAVDLALSRLAQADPRLSQIVECRFFGGLTIEETAGALGISPATVKRGWDTARAWLFKELKPGAL